MNAKFYLKSRGQHFMVALILLFALSAKDAKAQNLAINTDGSKADPNAILDIQSTSKGLLIPRMTTLQRMKIPQTNGLMVYDTTTKSFWYSDGNAWKSISVSNTSTNVTDAWLLIGNAGTADGTNFVGTTDNVPLNFKVNNQKAGRLDPIQRNTFWGYQSGTNITTARDNTGIGTAALFLTTTGFDNTALGANTLQNNSTGFSNTAVGRFALYYNDIGAGNTAIGTSALHSNRRGMDNTAVGGFALAANSGNSNTAVGSNSQGYGGSGSENTSVGANSLAAYERQGNGNTAIGYGALGLTDPRSAYNTAVGHSAHIAYGEEPPSSYCTVIGYNASARGNNSMALGNGAVAELPNKVRIGNAAVTVIEGQVPFTTPSDGRYKFNIQEDVKGLDFILQLRPVTYQFDVKRLDGSNGSLGMQASYNEAAQIRRSGFIAQEVEDAANKSGYNFSGIIKPKTEKEHYSLSYESFVVPLVKAVQEQQQIINEQNKKIDLLIQELNDIKKKLDNDKK